MDIHLIATQIIFDKIIEIVNPKDKEKLRNNLKELYMEIVQNSSHLLDEEKLKSILSFIDPLIRCELIDFIKNFNNKSIWVPKFLKIIMIVMIHINPDDIDNLKIIIEETDKMSCNSYKQNMEISNDFYLLAIAFLNSKNNYSDIHKQIELIYNFLPDDSETFISHFLKLFKKFDKENIAIIKNFIVSFIDIVDLVKKLFKDEDSQDEENNNQDEIISKMDELDLLISKDHKCDENKDLLEVKEEKKESYDLFSTEKRLNDILRKYQLNN